MTKNIWKLQGDISTFFIWLAEVVAQGHKLGWVTVNATGCGFPLEEMKYLFKFIFSYLRSGVEAKRGVEFRHSPRIASKIRQQVGNGVS